MLRIDNGSVEVTIKEIAASTFNYIRKSYLAFIDDFELVILEEAGFRNAPQVKAN